MIRDKICLRCYWPAVFIDEGLSVCLAHDCSEKRVVAVGCQTFIAHSIDDGRIDIAYNGLGPVFRCRHCRNARLGDRDRLLGICKVFVCGDFDAVAVKFFEDDEFRPIVHDSCIEREEKLHETRWGVRCEFETALHGIALTVGQYFTCCLIHDAAAKLIALPCLEITICDCVNEGDISVAH